MGRGPRMGSNSAEDDPLCETALKFAQGVIHRLLLAVLRLFQQQADFTDVASGQSDVFQCPVRSLLPWNGMWHPIPSLTGTSRPVRPGADTHIRTSCAGLRPFRPCLPA